MCVCVFMVLHSNIDCVSTQKVRETGVVVGVTLCSLSVSSIENVCVCVCWLCSMNVVMVYYGTLGFIGWCCVVSLLCEYFFFISLQEWFYNLSSCSLRLRCVALRNRV